MIKVQFIKSSGLEETIKNLPHNVAKSINNLAIKGYEIIREGTPKDTGRLYRSEKVKYAFVGNLNATIMTTIGERSYARFVELGTRPHWPPRQPILGWVMRKFRVTGREANRIAFLVSRKIARVGTKGQFFFTRGEEYIKNNIPRELERLGVAIEKNWEARR